MRSGSWANVCRIVLKKVSGFGMVTSASIKTRYSPPACFAPRLRACAMVCRFLSWYTTMCGVNDVAISTVLSVLPPSEIMHSYSVSFIV